MNALDYFQDRGIELRSDARTPLLLHETEQVFYVARGKVNLFYTALGAEDVESAPPGQEEGYVSLVGHKSHVFTALPGAALFGLKGSSETAFSIVGLSQQDTILYRMDRKELEADPTLRSALVDAWIADLLSGLPSVPAPKNAIRLVAGNEQKLRKGATVCSAPDLLWVEFLEGTFFYQDKEKWFLPTKGTFFPLTGTAWATAEESGLVRTVLTEELARKGRLSESLRAFHDRGLAFFDFKGKEYAERERERLELKKTYESDYLRSSLESLADVVNLRKPPLSRGPSQDKPLLAVCQTVGNAMGLDIVEPTRHPERLVSITEASRIRSRQVALADEWWKHDNGPLLGYLEVSDVPVALVPETRTRYRLWDPTTDVWQSVDKAVAETVQPFAVMFYRPFPHRMLGAIDLIKFGFEGLWKSDIATVILVGLLIELVALLIPIATGFIIDTLIPQAERSQLLQLGCFLALGAFAGFIFNLARSIASLRMESRMNATIQASVWDRLLGLPMPFFRAFNTGDLAVRTNSINAIRRLLSGAAMNAILSGLFSVMNLLVLFYYSTPLAFVACILVTVSMVLALISGRLSLKYQQEVSHLNGKLTGLVLQLVSGISKLQVSGALNRAFHLWTTQFSRKRKSEYKAKAISNAFNAFQTVYPLVCSLVIFYFVAKEQEKPLSTGGFLAFSSAFSAFMGAMLSLAGTVISLIVITPQFERAQPILKSLPENRDGKVDPGELRGDIEVSHVHFRYERNGPPILVDINLRIRPGEFIALVGPSGSGKSTLLRLLLGFEAANSGAIYMDGQDLAVLDLPYVRRQIGVVLQNSRIMSGDIFHNIVGATANLTIDDAWDSAEMAGLAEDIREMPMGMFTIIGEGGTTISGGQRQRLLIAQALVNKPRILYFDEATSALDNRTQDIVSRSLESLQATRIVIAHRLSTIINADRIVVIEKGRIVEQGNYTSLLKSNGIFTELAKRQLL